MEEGRDAVGSVGMTHVRSHKGEPWNEMADSLTEAAMNGCRAPSSRRELERWMMRFREIPVGAGWACAEMPPRCEEWKIFVRSSRTRLW